MNNDAKFEEEPMCRFKTNMKNLKNVDPITKSLKNLHFDGLLSNKV